MRQLVSTSAQLLASPRAPAHQPLVLGRDAADCRSPCMWVVGLSMIRAPGGLTSLALAVDRTT
jgi:hypothetical protein